VKKHNIQLHPFGSFQQKWASGYILFYQNQILRFVTDTNAPANTPTKSEPLPNPAHSSANDQIPDGKGWLVGKAHPD
jgi:hypothetical protein